MLMSILVGVLLTALTIGIHALGTTEWLRHLRKTKNEETITTGQMLKVLCYTAVILLLLQIAEVLCWAIAWLMIPQIPELRTLEEAVYFSMVTFTTLGFGDIIIAPPWRILSGIEAMNGLLIFGWSTALLYAVVNESMKRRFSDSNPFSPGDPE